MPDEDPAHGGRTDEHPDRNDSAAAASPGVTGDQP